MTGGASNTGLWPRSIFHPAFMLATWFGSGLLRPAPGTWGSLAALPFAYAWLQLGGVTALALACAVVTVLGVWASGVFTHLTGREDASQIVIDEVAGQWLALLPLGIWASNRWYEWLAAFLLFRLLDIVKPWPASWLDLHVKGGWGVMLDDLAAGIYTAAMLAGWFLLW